MAATASGNMALILSGFRPDCLLAFMAADERFREFLELSTLNLFIASLKRFDIGSKRC
jgi:hypothetical protein